MDYSMSIHTNKDDLIKTNGFDMDGREAHYIRIGDAQNSIDLFLTVTQLRALKANIGNHLNDWELANLPIAT